MIVLGAEAIQRRPSACSSNRALEPHRRGPVPPSRYRAMIKESPPDRCGCPAPIAIASVVRHAVQPFLVRARQVATLAASRAAGGTWLAVRPQRLRRDNDETLIPDQISPEREKNLSNPAAGWAIVTKSD